MPFYRGEVKIREIGQMTVLEKDIVSDSHLPIFQNFRSWHRQQLLTAIPTEAKLTRD